MTRQRTHKPLRSASQSGSSGAGRGSGRGSGVIRAELAGAYAEINRAFNRLPVDVQEQTDVTVDGLEAEIDKAIRTDDRERAGRVIRAWRSHWLWTIERAGP